MKSKVNFLLFLTFVASIVFIILAMVSNSSEEFHGWGSSILHHVGNPDAFWIEPSWASLMNISKPVIMLFIAAGLTLTMALWATKRYRDDINAQPKGISHIYEILMEFINNDIIIPNIGKDYIKT